VSRPKRSVDETPPGYDGPVRYERRVREIPLSEYGQVFIGASTGTDQLVEVEDFVKVPDIVFAAPASAELPDPRVLALVDLYRRARGRYPRASRITRSMLGDVERPSVGEDAVKSRLRVAGVTLAQVARLADDPRSDSPARHP
jgi:hypothetical protein